ncbi:tautomerase family protein [Streptomyces cinerochromogenes]|uniref:tautomerase family protein n=1 Tax=Streptomyces cinerochromogenes TaxID=66422 RepID=UPI0033A721C9
MPLWTIYHPPGAYTPQQKQQFSADITGFYTRYGNLPAFYVVTVFQEIDADSFYIGGEPSATSVRIKADHIAVHTDDPDTRVRTRQILARILAPHTTDRGLYCEFHIDETPRDLWVLDGMAPPPLKSEAHQLWVQENRPVPY